jgi:hypothetical protein
VSELLTFIHTIIIKNAQKRVLWGHVIQLSIKTLTSKFGKWINPTGQLGNWSFKVARWFLETFRGRSIICCINLNGWFNHIQLFDKSTAHTDWSKMKLCRYDTGCIFIWSFWLKRLRNTSQNTRCDALNLSGNIWPGHRLRKREWRDARARTACSGMILYSIQYTA